MKAGDGEAWRKAAAAGVTGGELNPSGTKGSYQKGQELLFSHVGLLRGMEKSRLRLKFLQCVRGTVE